MKKYMKFIFPPLVYIIYWIFQLNSSEYKIFTFNEKLVEFLVMVLPFIIIYSLGIMVYMGIKKDKDK